MMREAIREGSIPPGRILDVCAQGVVWFTKRKEISEDAFRWCVSTGSHLSQTRSGLNAGALSSWYRGIAMLPAAQGDAAGTRRYMRLAEDAAHETYSARPTAFDLNTVKTYHESTIKEHMYVTGDLELAEAAAEALIALDPVWSPSYGELAEAYRKFGKVEKAANLYEQASSLGPPYVGYHLLQAARCRAQHNDDEVALSHYIRLAEIAPGFRPVIDEGSEVATRASASRRQLFMDTVERRSSAS